MAISFGFQPLVFSRLMMVYVAGITIILLAAARFVRRMIQARLRSHGIGVERVLLVGAGDIAHALLRTMIARKDLGYLPVGYLDDDPTRGDVDIGRIQGLGGVNNLESTLAEHDVDLVVITLP